MRFKMESFNCPHCEAEIIVDRMNVAEDSDRSGSYLGMNDIQLLVVTAPDHPDYQGVTKGSLFHEAIRLKEENDRLRKQLSEIFLRDLDRELES